MTWRLDTAVADRIRTDLPTMADDVVGAIIDEVPSYADAFAGSMGATIRDAVQIALGGFLSLATGRGSGEDAPTTPRGPAVDGAYQLGRGEARSGRTSEAILSAYRIGARVSWRRMSAGAVAAGIAADDLARFAELVFAYIDELSAASVAGHSDEEATAGRVRQRLLDRLTQHLLDGAPEATVVAAAERADWTLPTTLTAVVVPAAQTRSLLSALPAGTLRTADLPGLDDAAVLLVPDAPRAQVVRLAERAGRAAVGPGRPWAGVRTSLDRAVRALRLGLTGDTDTHLTRLVLTADADALADLRTRALAPLADLREGAAEKLADTLRAWLLHQGRRDDVAATLFVHPQTVRYRMGQLRELYGDALEDPATVLALTVALGVPGPPGALGGET